MLLELCNHCCKLKRCISTTRLRIVNRRSHAHTRALSLTRSEDSSSETGAGADKAKVGEDVGRIVFLGSDSFSVHSLQALLELYPPAALTIVVSNQHNVVGKYSAKKSLKVMLWEEFKSITKHKNEESVFDLGVVASFGFLIPKYVIESCRLGILNVHASLLPKWRGAAPIAHAIINGDKMTGITIMKIAPHRFDVGPILHTRTVAITDHIKTPELTTTLAQLGAEALLEVLKKLPFYVNKSVPQNINEGTPAPKLTQEIAEIKWNSQTVSNIYNLFRGLCGTYKVRSNYEGRRVDFDEVMLAFGNSSTVSLEINIDNFPKNCDNFLVGQIMFWNKIICVKCFNVDSTDKSVRSNWIFIRKVKVGSKWMSASDFNNGYLTKSEGNKFFSYNSMLDNRLS